ncbi:(S)-mandelate dehydrogenase [Burkholderia sp. 8Y]|uniref:alpha-hydroxy acid oxidase n=1 Tax=Burkholderia sp. 8Y TaxID=2653133 RepID=UPI0012F31DFE|nr:alpha-hydroxy acid oxidase [Burkholderia sp. 8Y]VXB43319.1 (S)-mandelate dehydrogenase [Burkholderia sp. 8Y]
MQRRLYTGNDPRRAHSIEELRAMAQRRVPNFCFEYVEGGAEEEATLQRNRSVFADIAFQPRSLVDVSTRDISIDLFGRRSAAPFMIGPTGFSGLLSREGDIALASAAAAAGIPFILSNASTVPLERVVATAGGRVWMQVYMYRTRDFVAKLAERAKHAQVEALVVTTDSAIYGKREWDLRNYARPLKLDLRNTLDVIAHPRWMRDVLWPNGMPKFANLGDLLPPGQDSVRGAASALAKELDPSLSWDDIRWLRDRWPGRLIIKGLIHPEDAARAVSVGADGIVLSNHGGRQLDGSVAALEVLPEVVAEVNGRLAVLLDGGFRRGSDIVKAMGLGADAVLLGRATTWGLAAGGRAGVDRAIEILKTEVDRVIGLLGCKSIAELDTRYLQWTRRNGQPMQARTPQPMQEALTL